MKKIAFTLAEVLITLTIIGVIAALTIPNLMQKHQEQEFIQKLKKNYTVLANATKMAIRENGSPDEWDKGPSNTNAGARKIASYITPYLKVQSECANALCFADSYKGLGENDSYWTTINAWSRNTGYFYQILLQDGTAVAFWSAGSGKAGDAIIVDLNNKKGPNRWGVDTFMFITGPDGLLTSGYNCPKLNCNSTGNQCTYKSTHNKNGATCTTHVIYKGNMDYLRRDISNEW